MFNRSRSICATPIFMGHVLRALSAPRASESFQQYLETEACNWSALTSCDSCGSSPPPFLHGVGSIAFPSSPSAFAAATPTPLSTTPEETVRRSQEDLRRTVPAFARALLEANDAFGALEHLSAYHGADLLGSELVAAHPTVKPPVPAPSRHSLASPACPAVQPFPQTFHYEYNRSTVADLLRLAVRQRLWRPYFVDPHGAVAPAGDCNAPPQASTHQRILADHRTHVVLVLEGTGRSDDRGAAHLAAAVTRHISQIIHSHYHHNQRCSFSSSEALAASACPTLSVLVLVLCHAARIDEVQKDVVEPALAEAFATLTAPIACDDRRAMMAAIEVRGAALPPRSMANWGEQSGYVLVDLISRILQQRHHDVALLSDYRNLSLDDPTLLSQGTPRPPRLSFGVHSLDPSLRGNLDRFYNSRVNAAAPPLVTFFTS